MKQDSIDTSEETAGLLNYSIKFAALIAEVIVGTARHQSLD